MHYLKTISILILLIGCMTAFFAQNNDASSDASSDNISKKIKYFSFNFYTIDDYNAVFEYDQLYTLNRYNETDFTFYNRLNPVYSFNHYINNTVYLDFYELYLVNNSYRDNPEIINENDIISNIFTTGIENEFRLSKALKFFLNCDFVYTSSTDRYFSIDISPFIRLTADYYFGFFFDIKNFFTFETVLIENYFNYIINGYLKIGYEFFRFYGPKKFRFAIQAENETTVTFPSAFYNFTVKNEIEAGFYFSFYGFKYLIYFIMNAKYDMSANQFNYNYAGFKAGIEYTVYKLKFSANYSGSIDLTEREGIWLNEIEIFFKFFINK